MTATQAVKILVIDDHEIVRRGVKQILEEVFSHIEGGEADSSQKAIAAVQQEPWDLGIVDISLPDQSGLELLCELHSTAPGLPLMVLSLRTKSNTPFVRSARGRKPISPTRPHQKNWPGRSSKSSPAACTSPPLLESIWPAA